MHRADFRRGRELTDRPPRGFMAQIGGPKWVRARFSELVCQDVVRILAGSGAGPWCGGREPQGASAPNSPGGEVVAGTATRLRRLGAGTSCNPLYSLSNETSRSLVVLSFSRNRFLPTSRSRTLRRHSTDLGERLGEAAPPATILVDLRLRNAYPSHCNGRPVPEAAPHTTDPGLTSVAGV